MRNNKIVTAMACAAASMLAGLTLAPSAMAAGTTITDQDKVDIRAYDSTLKKVDAGNVNTLPDGAQFQIQRNGKWMKLDPNPNPTRRCRRAEGNRPARPNEPQTSPSPTNHRHPTGDGRTA